MESNDEQVSDIRAAVESAKAEERFEEAAIGLIDLAEKAESSEERAAAIEEAATLFHDKLGDPDQAAVLRRVLVELYEESEAFSEACKNFPLAQLWHECAPLLSAYLPSGQTGHVYTVLGSSLWYCP